MRLTHRELKARAHLHIVRKHPDWLQPVLSPWLSMSPSSQQLTYAASPMVRTTCLLSVSWGGRQQLYKKEGVAVLEGGMTAGAEALLLLRVR